MGHSDHHSLLKPCFKCEIPHKCVLKSFVYVCLCQCWDCQSLTRGDYSGTHYFYVFIFFPYDVKKSDDRFKWQMILTQHYGRQPWCLEAFHWDQKLAVEENVTSYPFKNEYFMRIMQMGSVEPAGNIRPKKCTVLQLYEILVL